MSWRAVCTDEQGHSTRAIIVPGGMLVSREVFSYSEAATPAIAMVFVSCGTDVAKKWMEKNP